MSENLVLWTLVGAHGNGDVSLRSEGKGKKGPNTSLFSGIAVKLEESSLTNRAAVEQAFNCLLISVHQIYHSLPTKKTAPNPHLSFVNWGKTIYWNESTSIHHPKSLFAVSSTGSGSRRGASDRSGAVTAVANGSGVTPSKFTYFDDNHNRQQHITTSARPLKEVNLMG